MKYLFFTAFLFSVTFSAQADQLAYISKKQAKKAARKLKKFDSLIFFCGCCDNDISEKVFVTNVEFRHTGYEDYYEVVLTYTNQNGETKSHGIDLAYIWIEDKDITFGQYLKYNHDPCKETYKNQ